MTVAAISTPQATGGIGIIRISGDEAISIADKVFSGKRRLSQLKGYTAAFGHIVQDGDVLDECVATVFRGPHSFTGENVVELSCHGGLYVLKDVLRAVLSAGAKPAGPGEFTKRAFLNGRLDLTEAEAVMSLIGAQGKNSAKAAITALDGALSKKIRAVNEELLMISATLGAWVDYPDDEIEELSNDKILSTLNSAEEELSDLLDRYDAGMVVINGVKTAIIGKPNAGKSALMNLLSGYERSIVTDVAGTTRDVVEGSVNLDGITLHLCDTAGIHQTDNIVEGIGIEKARQSVEQAGLVLAVFDGSRELDDADREIIQLCKNTKVVAIINKSDLEQKIDTDVINYNFNFVVTICAKDGSGLDWLSEAIQYKLCTDAVDTSAAMLSNERQRQDTQNALSAIKEAKQSLELGMTLDCVNVCIDDAIGYLLSLTGERATEAVVDTVFANFCVGK